MMEEIEILFVHFKKTSGLMSEFQFQNGLLNDIKKSIPKITTLDLDQNSSSDWVSVIKLSLKHSKTSIFYWEEIPKDPSILHTLLRSRMRMSNEDLLLIGEHDVDQFKLFNKKFEIITIEDSKNEFIVSSIEDFLINNS